MNAIIGAASSFDAVKQASVSPQRLPVSVTKSLSVWDVEARSRTCPLKATRARQLLGERGWGSMSDAEFAEVLRYRDRRFLDDNEVWTVRQALEAIASDHR